MLGWGVECVGKGRDGGNDVETRKEVIKDSRDEEKGGGRRQ